MSSEYSSKGQMWGYGRHHLFGVVRDCAPGARGVGCGWSCSADHALSGVWLGFSYFAFRRLPHRPGPPFATVNVYTEGWCKTYRLLALLWRTELNTFYFLILFFIF